MALRYRREGTHMSIALASVGKAFGSVDALADIDLEARPG